MSPKDRTQSASGGESGDGEPTFEVSLQKLETIVRQLEDGALGLTESLTRYEEGLRCLKQCHVMLEQAERKVELMTGLAADGTPIVQDFDEGDLTLEEKAQSRSRRRSKGEKKAEEPADETTGPRRLFE